MSVLSTRKGASLGILVTKDQEAKSVIRFKRILYKIFKNVKRETLVFYSDLNGTERSVNWSRVTSVASLSALAT